MNTKIVILISIILLAIIILLFCCTSLWQERKLNITNELNKTDQNTERRDTIWWVNISGILTSIIIIVLASYLLFKENGPQMDREESLVQPSSRPPISGLGSQSGPLPRSTVPGSQSESQSGSGTGRGRIYDEISHDMALPLESQEPLDLRERLNPRAPPLKKYNLDPLPIRYNE